MSTLVENVGPDKIDTPLRPLLRAFAASPYGIAPERETELHELVEAKQLRIWLDATKDTFDVDVSQMMRRIRFPLKALERLWGYAYCYSLFFDLYTPATRGQFIDLRDNGENAAARRLLLWAYEAEKSGTCPPWPTETPRPDQTEPNERLRPANQIFLMMSGFILLHEVGHLALGHCEKPPANFQESIQHEFQADQWASDWIMSRWEKYKTEEKVFIQRSVGIAFALAALGGIEIHTVATGVERDHPNPAERLLAFLDRWMPEPTEGVLPPKATAWKVGPAILHTHFLVSGKLLDPKKKYPSFRQYLEEAKSLF